MFKEIKTTAIGFMVLMLFISIFTVSNPTSSAGVLADIFACRAKVDVSYDEEAANDPILPLDMVKEIPVTISYKVEGVYDEDITPDYQDEGSVIPLYLEIDETPEWCDATINPAVLTLNPTPEWTDSKVTLNIKVYENAHAFAEGNIGLKIKADSFGAIKGDTFSHNISFISGYLPILKINTPEETCGFVNPGETKKFDIELENLGNAKTNIAVEILKVPEDWTVSIVSNIIIGTKTKGEETKKTISLIVRPSDSFGYHNEGEVIQVKFIPSFFKDSSLKGSEYLVSFIVKSKGFSAPGFETFSVLAMFALVALALIVKKRKLRGKK